MIKCPTCNIENEDKAIMCSSCGQPIGQKFDTDKTQWHLLPWEAIEAIVKIMMFGAKKYAPNNWRYVKPPIRYIDACMRHLTAWLNGETVDQETGYSHLWHAGCCIVFAIWHEMKGNLTNVS